MGWEKGGKGMECPRTNVRCTEGCIEGCAWEYAQAFPEVPERDTCHFCGNEVDAPATPTHVNHPVVGDEEWAACTAEHEFGCQWVAEQEVARANAIATQAQFRAKATH
jgi:hypothetical protein